MNGTMMPPGTVHPKPNPATKWFLFILFGLILVIGLIIAAYYVSYSDKTGVTVIRMEGTMVTGQVSDADTVGSEVVGGELRDAADDPMIEAIVLRVNSPGGTPAAAQEIIRDLDYARSKKPVVVSMGDLATSAAYYVSAHADKIYANADTFTSPRVLSLSLLKIVRTLVIKSASSATCTTTSL